MKRQRIVAGRSQRARWIRCPIGACEVSAFVGQTDADQRAPGTLRAVDERRWNLTSRGRRTHLPSELGGPCDQLIVEDNPDALARPHEEEDALVALVAMISEEQSLGAELDQLGLVGAPRDVRPLAALVVDRRDPAPLALEQVDLGAQAECFRSERHRTLVDLDLVVAVIL